jgi:hypothetical protein
VLGQLDGKGSYAARACLNEDLLALFSGSALSTRACHAVSATRGTEADSSIVRFRGLSASDASLTGTNCSKRTDPEIIGPRIDLVAGFELPHASARL